MAVRSARSDTPDGATPNGPAAFRVQDSVAFRPKNRQPYSGRDFTEPRLAGVSPALAPPQSAIHRSGHPGELRR